MPTARRAEPLYLQISDHYAQLIASGELPAGAKLPTIEVLAGQWGVSHQTAWRAAKNLESAGLVAVSRDYGIRVTGPRLVLGPQQRITATAFPAAERVEVVSAGVVPAPDYVVPILGLDGPQPGGTLWVIRREQVSYEPGGAPFMLAVQWFHPSLGDAVPELSAGEPIPSPGGAVTLIAERTGRQVTRGRQAREAREIRDDGREGPLLRLEAGAAVLAEVYLWMDDRDVIEYGEYCLIPNRVTENTFTVA